MPQTSHIPNQHHESLFCLKSKGESHHDSVGSLRREFARVMGREATEMESLSIGRTCTVFQGAQPSYEIGKL